MASLRMLGAKEGYYDPTNWKECQCIDQILDAWVDIHDKFYEVAMFMQGTAQEKNVKMQEYIEKLHHPVLKFMEDNLGKNGGPYLAGKKLTIADFAMAAFLLSAWEAEGGPFVAQFKGPLSQYPKVTAYNLKLRETLAETIKRVAAE